MSKDRIYGQCDIGSQVVYCTHQIADSPSSDASLNLAHWQAGAGAFRCTIFFTSSDFDADRHCARRGLAALFFRDPFQRPCHIQLVISHFFLSWSSTVSGGLQALCCAGACILHNTTTTKSHDAEPLRGEGHWPSRDALADPAEPSCTEHRMLEDLEDARRGRQTSKALPVRP